MVTRQRNIGYYWASPNFFSFSDWLFERPAKFDFDSRSINHCLFGDDIKNLINDDFINYYNTPGNVYDLLKFAKEKDIDLKEIRLKDFLSLVIDKSYFKEDIKIRNLSYDLIEFFILKDLSVFYSDLSSYFLKKIKLTKNFNLDDESLFLEINSKLLNG